MPKPKKGKKKGKILTEEEKSKVAELKSLAEKEKLERRRRLTKSFLKLKKDKEYNLMKVNDAKLLDLWRPKLRQLKCQEILEDYKLMQAAFERTYRKKDELIVDLEDILGKNEEEYDNAFDIHLQDLDNLMDFYRKRLEEMRQVYGSQKDKLMNAMSEEQERIKNEHDKSLEYLDIVTTGVHDKYEQRSNDSKAELAQKQEEMTNKVVEDTYAIQVETDTKFNEIWNEIEGILDDYEKTMGPLHHQFMIQKEVDDTDETTIQEQLEAINKLKVGLERLSIQGATYTTTLESLTQDLNDKRNHLVGQYKLEKARYDEITLLGKSNIRQLAMISGSVLKDLDTMLDQREKVMRAIEQCRKKEGLDEAEGSDLPHAAEKQLEEEEPLQEAENLLSVINTAIETFSGLDQFWTRYNKTVLQLKGLKHKKEAMIQDNKALKLALATYMGDLNPNTRLAMMTVTDEAEQGKKKKMDTLDDI